MKKFVLMMLTVLFVAACGGAEEAPATDTAPAAEPAMEEVAPAEAQPSEEPAADTMAVDTTGSGADEG